MANYYMILDEHGSELCNGLSEQTYESVAQSHADRLGATVWAVASDAPEDDEGERFEPATDDDPEPARDVHYHVGGTANCPACMDYADYLADQEKDGDG